MTDERSQPMSDEATRADEQKRAGRGGLAVLVAKVFFILTGLTPLANVLLMRFWIFRNPV